MKKNLLIISHSYNSFIKDQIEAISPNFNKVYVFVRYKPIAELSKFFGFLSMYKGHQKEYAIDHREKPDNVEVIPVSIFYLPGNFFYKYIGNSLFKKCLKYIQKNNIKFDLIHAHFAWTSGYVAMELSKVFEKPYIVTLHGEDIYVLPFIDESWKKKITEILNAADRIITVGNKNADAMKKLNIKSNPIIIGNGFNKDLFYPIEKQKARNKIKYNSNAPLILSVGSLDKIKGHIYLLEALSLLKQKKIYFHTILIGSGSEEDKLKLFISNSNLNKNVTIIKNLPHHELNTYYNSADVFCLPSIHESFGVVQIEAWACGIPVVATRNGGSDNLFQESDGVGYLVERQNSIELAEMLNKSLSTDWDKNHILNFSQKFDIHLVSKKIITVYNSLKAKNNS